MKYSIVFDFGNVIVNYQSKLAFKDSPFTDEHVDKFLAFIRPYHILLDCGCPFRVVINSIKISKPEFYEAAQYWSNNFHMTISEYNQELIETVYQLNEHGIALYGLSNMPEETMAQIVASHPVFQLFEHMVISSHVNCVKPDPQIYHILQAISRKQPEELIFFDDMQENVDAANLAGWKGHLFTNAKQLRTVLEDYSILAKG